mgnify:CR=1 FL=1
MRKLQYILAPVLLLSAACGKEPVSEGPELPGEEIVLSANLPEDWSPLQTKAEITSTSDLQSAGFGVYAYYTGANDYTNISSASGVIFNNRQVSYSSSAWSYSTTGAGKEYWPTKAGEKVSFFAYAPWGDWHGTVSTTGTAPSITYTVIDELTAAKIGAQKDLLWGTQSNGSPYRNVTRDDVDGQVNFHFRHAISKMRFYVAAGATGETVGAETTPGSWSATSFPDKNPGDSYGYVTVSSTERNYYRRRYHNYTVTTDSYIVSQLGISSLYDGGALSLNNSGAYVPLWDVSSSGSKAYTVPSTLLNSSLSSGIPETPTPVMSSEGYYVYVIPGARPTFTLTYNVSRETVSKRYYEYEYQKYTKNSGGSTWRKSGDPWTEDKAAESYGTPTTSTVSTGSTASATMPGTILPSRKYDVNLYLQGPKVELVLVPQRWEVEEMEYDYTDDENPRIQELTYDSDYIDYAIGGDVYINNRLGKFYFCLGEGKYKYWQASMISSDGNEVFGFCDSDGNFLYDGEGHLQSIIRGPIDGSMSNIYMRALNSSSTTGGRAKLRIYLFDSDEVPTIALNLVKMAGVTEWTIVQNAN